MKLLDEGRIPYKKVGNRRRVQFADLLKYKQAEDARRGQIFAELAAEAQKFCLDY